MSTDTRDPNYDWTEIFAWGSTKPVAIVQGPCRHLDLVPVESLGDVVAHLCVICDLQLPAEWQRNGA